MGWWEKRKGGERRGCWVEGAEEKRGVEDKDRRKGVRKKKKKNMGGWG